MRPLRILADENIPSVKEAFAGLGKVETRPGRTLKASDCDDVDLLLVRSVTPVNEQLLANSPVRFVASATIGEDHVDKDWLSSRDIGFSSSPGCNADSAAEYVITQLMALHAQGLFQFQGRRAGIIGCGNVGSRVRHRLERLGMRCLLNDPPRQERGDAEHFVSLDALRDCDLITLHVPMVRSGPHTTHHLIDTDYLRGLNPGAVIINTSRGSAIDNAALLADIRTTERKVILDVWEGEPRINLDLLDAVVGASPHVAGYSLEGRLRGTEMIHQASCRHFGLEPHWSPWEGLKAPETPDVYRSSNPLTTLRDLILACYNPAKDRESLLKLKKLSPTERGTFFDDLRKHYPLRREFASYPIKSSGEANTDSLLRDMGFRLC